MSFFYDLVRRLDQTERKLTALANPRTVPSVTVVDGLYETAVTVETGGVDEDGNPVTETVSVATLGQQPDGTTALVVHTGPVPPTPKAPTAVTAPGTLTIRWNGQFADEDGDGTDEVAPADFQYVEAHAALTSDVSLGYVVMGTAASLRGTIAVSGGEVVVGDLAPGAYTVALLTRTIAGVASPLSYVSTATPVAIPSQAEVDDLSEDVALLDASVAATLALATLKNRAYWQAAAPTGLTAANTNDVWYDTDDGFKMNRWNGTAWVPVEAGSAFFSDTISGKTINGSVINGATITGGTFQTATSGQRWRIDPNVVVSGENTYLRMIGYSGSAYESAPGYAGVGLWTHVDGGVTKVSPFTRINSPKLLATDGVTVLRDAYVTAYGRNREGDESAVEAVGDRVSFYTQGGSSLSVNGVNSGLGREIQGDVSDGTNTAVLWISPGASGIYAKPNTMPTGYATKIVAEPDRAYIDSPIVDIYGQVQLHALTAGYVSIGGGANYTSSGAANGYPTGGPTYVFTAPASGAIFIIVSGTIKAPSAGSASVAGFELREGSTVGAGTVVAAYQANRALRNDNAQYVGGSKMVPWFNLTPGSQYNIRYWVVAAASGAVFADMYLHVIPLP